MIFDYQAEIDKIKRAIIGKGVSKIYTTKQIDSANVTLRTAEELLAQTKLEFKKNLSDDYISLILYKELKDTIARYKDKISDTKNKIKELKTKIVGIDEEVELMNRAIVDISVLLTAATENVIGLKKKK